MLVDYITGIILNHTNCEISSKVKLIGLIKTIFCMALVDVDMDADYFM